MIVLFKLVFHGYSENQFGGKDLSESSQLREVVTYHQRYEDSSIWAAF